MASAWRAGPVRGGMLLLAALLFAPAWLAAGEPGLAPCPSQVAEPPLPVAYHAGSLLLPAAATPRTFDVRDFGATPDDDTDDRRAILAAVEAAQRAGGGTVTFPAGRYLTSTIEFRSLAGVGFAGAGRSRTTIQRVGAGPCSFIFRECTDLAIRDLALDANGCLNYGGTFFGSCRRVRITGTRYFDGNTEARRKPHERTDIYSYVFGRGKAHNEDITLSGNLVEDLQLEVDYCRRVRITNNVVKRPTSTAGIGTFSLQWDAVTGEDLCGEDILIAGNTIVDLNDAYTAVAVHLDPARHKDGTPLNNVVYRDIRILDNTIVYTPSGARPAGRAVQVGATDSSQQTIGVVFDRIRVEGNRIYVPTTAPINADAGRDDVFIFGNHSRQFTGGPDFLFTNVAVRNNTLYRDVKPDTRFVAWYAQGANCVLENNRVLPYAPPPERLLKRGHEE